MCPCSVRTGSPVSESHSSTAPSSLPTARMSPSGLYATELTQSLCPGKLRSSWPFCRSQTRTTWSAPPEARCRPSGLNAIELSGIPWLGRVTGAAPGLASFQTLIE